MLDELRRLFAHLRWADERALRSLEGADPPPRALEVLAHVLGAEHVWLSRLRQTPAAVAVWPELGVRECAALAEENAAGYEALLAQLHPEELTRPVAYRNSAGELFDSRVGDILLHVAMHGSYHRGQVALLLRQAGREPSATDYIAFVRGGAAPARRGPG